MTLVDQFGKNAQCLLAYKISYYVYAQAIVRLLSAQMPVYQQCRSRSDCSDEQAGSGATLVVRDILVVISLRPASVRHRFPLDVASLILGLMQVNRMNAFYVSKGKWRHSSVTARLVHLVRIIV